MQKLNVITRTSGRPNFFKFCKESIDSQLYPDINHIVIIDEKNDNSYVHNYPNISTIITIPDGKYTTVDPTTGNFIGMDAYLNDALENLPQDELFCIMDDDDFYVSPSSLTEAVNALEDGDLVFFRVKASTRTVPSSETFTKIDKTIPSEILNGEELSIKIEDLKESIAKTRTQLKEIINENTQREQHNTRIQVILEQTREFEKELEGVKKGLSKQEKVFNNLEVLKRSFSTNGLVAYKLENLVKELEDLANEYLAELSDGRFNINFVVANDKLNVDLSDNGNSVDILALSSGELARVNTATLVAIRKLMSSISKSRINVLFLDEVINVLDEMGREKLVEVLLAEEGLNTYIVSHGWTHPLLEKIEVVKENSISRLE